MSGLYGYRCSKCRQVVYSLSLDDSLNASAAHRCEPSGTSSRVVCDAVVSSLVDARFAMRPEGAVSVTLSRGELRSLLGVVWGVAEGYGAAKAGKVQP